MLFRTYREALDCSRPFAGWKENVILEVKLNNGKVFYRTYEFDSMQDKCKKCRNAFGKRSKYLKNSNTNHGRMASTGHVCDTCGNPYASFVRPYRTKRSGSWITIEAWGGGKRSH